MVQHLRPRGSNDQPCAPAKWSAKPRRYAAAVVLFFAVLIVGSAPADAQEANGREAPVILPAAPDRSLTTLWSGHRTLPPALRRLESDPAKNPAYAWYDLGVELWSSPAGPEGRKCSDCHRHADRSMRGVALRYPRVRPATDELITLENRINMCRTEFQGASLFAMEGDSILALSIFVRRQSAGMRLKGGRLGRLAEEFAAGQIYYETRRGQRNLSCKGCHEQHAGARLRGLTLSQGHPNASPAYVTRYERPASLHRRFQECNRRQGAVVRPVGADVYRQLELYLTWRGAGLEVETPGVRQ